MGLDITAYSKLEPFEGEIPLDAHGNIDYDWVDNQGMIHAFAYKGFEQSTRGLRNQDVPSDYLHGGAIADSWYQRTEGTETHNFRAGSYSGYGEFRDMLAKLVGYDSASAVYEHPTDLTGLPFYELINFADNEGCIGPEAAADLLIDFRARRDRWLEFVGKQESWDDGRYFIGKYDDWIKAFELASDNGLVDFH